MAIPAASATQPADVENLALLTTIHNEKCKAAAGFLYNFSAAIFVTGVVMNVVRPDPQLDLKLFLITATFAAMFYIVGNNNLDQMQG